MTLRTPGTDLLDSSELGPAEGPIRGGLSRVPGVAWNSGRSVECSQQELGERQLGLGEWGGEREIPLPSHLSEWLWLGCGSSS